MAVAGLVLGILSLIGGWIPGVNVFPMWVLGIIGIILSSMARSKARKEGQPTATATAGLVLSIIGTIMALIAWLACIICAGVLGAGVLGAGSLLNY